MPIYARGLAKLLLLLPLSLAGQASAQTAGKVAAPPPAAEQCKAANGEIVVCGDRSSDKYRLPPQPEGFDPWGDVESVSRERHRLLGPTAGGIGSCSTVGPGGWTGCDIQVIKRAEQQGKRVGINSVGVQVGRKRLDVWKP